MEDSVPSLKELRGIHAGDYEEGAVLAELRRIREVEKKRERARADELRTEP